MLYMHAGLAMIGEGYLAFSHQITNGSGGPTSGQEIIDHHNSSLCDLTKNGVFQWNQDTEIHSLDH